jgi:hypothetical protein
MRSEPLSLEWLCFPVKRSYSPVAWNSPGTAVGQPGEEHTLTFTQPQIASITRGGQRKLAAETFQFKQDRSFFFVKFCLASSVTSLISSWAIKEQTDVAADLNGRLIMNPGPGA